MSPQNFAERQGRRLTEERSAALFCRSLAPYASHGKRAPPNHLLLTKHSLYEKLTDNLSPLTSENKCVPASLLIPLPTPMIPVDSTGQFLYPQVRAEGGEGGGGGGGVISSDHSMNRMYSSV